MGQNGPVSCRNTMVFSVPMFVYRIASQPNRVSGTSADDSGLEHLFTIDSPGGISPAGPLANPLGICET